MVVLREACKLAYYSVVVYQYFKPCVFVCEVFKTLACIFGSHPYLLGALPLFL